MRNRQDPARTTLPLQGHPTGRLDPDGRIVGPTLIACGAIATGAGVWLGIKALKRMWDNARVADSNRQREFDAAIDPNRNTFPSLSPSVQFELGRAAREDLREAIFLPGTFPGGLPTLPADEVDAAIDLIGWWP
jgi:hypothetical protein